MVPESREAGWLLTKQQAKFRCEIGNIRPWVSIISAISRVKGFAAKELQVVYSGTLKHK